MNELKIFRKVVTWKLEENDTNHILKITGMTMGQFTMVMDATNIKIENIANGLKAMIQDFNQKYYENYLQAKALNELPDRAASDDKETKEIPVTKEAVIQSTAINESKTKALSTQRQKQRAQEKLFHDKLIQLYDFCPDHMTVDVILKRK